MQFLLTVSTLLGGVTAIWFFWDKRGVIRVWFTIRTRDAINPLSLADDDFVFLSSKSDAFLRAPYLPANPIEEEMCKSLTNSGVLTKRGNYYRLSRAGKLILKL